MAVQPERRAETRSLLPSLNFVQLRKKKSPLFHKFSQLLLGRADEAAAAELPEEAEVPRIARYRLLNADCELRDVSEAELPGLATLCRNPNSFFWLDLQTSSKATLVPLMEQFGIQQLTGFDDFYLSTAERVDLQPSCVFVSITELDPSREEVAINVALFSRCIVTFHSCPSITVERLLETMDRLEEEVTAPEWILLGVMHFAMASFLLHVENMHTEVKNINALSLQFTGRSDDSDVLLRINVTRTMLLELKTALLSRREVLLALTESSEGRMHEEAMILLQELSDLPELWVTRLERTNKMLDSLTTTFLERVSFEVALTSERSNTVQKKFNAVGTIMLPLLVTQGLFTMNVKVPGSDVDNLDWFIAIVSVSAAVFVVAFAVFRRFDWL